MEDKVKELVKKLQIRYDIPAVSVCFVKNSEEFIFGQHKCDCVKSRNECPDQHLHQRVDADTMFGIGSVSKSFTSLCLAVLLQSNPGLTWDTPLKEIFEDFSLQNDYMEERACMRDLLSHKMGIELGETDFGYMMGNIERENIIKNLFHLPIAAEFRTKMMYNNFMYTVAGLIAEKVTGKEYEDLITETIFNLLGMENTTFLDKIDNECKNIAFPHVGIDGKSTPVDLEVHRMSSSVGPAASICSSANDMLKWIKFLLSKGKVGDIQVVNPKLLEECWKPQFALPRGKLEWDGYVSKPIFPVTETRDTYGFGWYIGTYRGYRMIAHSGELFGYDCLVTLYPDMNIGIYTNMNGPGGEAAFISNQLLHYYISDLLLEQEPWLNEENIVTFPEPWKTRDAYFIPKFKSIIETTLPSSHSLDVYTGNYEHVFLGKLEIYLENGQLGMKMGKIGMFDLFPNGMEDEFRMVGSGHLEFIHQWDLYSPSDWMTIKFVVLENESERKAKELYCSLFESGPVFRRC